MTNSNAPLLQTIKLVLHFWKHYKNQDKFIIFNPYSEQIFFGAKKCENISAAPYVLYPLSFLDIDVVNDARAFESYFVVEKDKILFNNLDCCSEINVKSASISEFIGSLNFDKNITESFEKKHSVVRSNDHYKNWEALFDAISAKISNKELTKVVASRKIKFTSEDAFCLPSIFLNLFKNNFNSYIFAYCESDKIFFGATPELLVEKKANTVRSFALAGTIKKDCNNVHEQGVSFLNDEKNLFEHHLVVDSIVESMQKLGTNIEIGNVHILELKNLLHIKTDVCATNTCGYDKENLSIGAKQTEYTIFDWVKELHPTPALGGIPKKAAVDFIKKHEGYKRGRYGAPFGIVDKNGDGFFIVGIRSATIENDTLYAYAGCGIVEKSNCKEEYDEIDNKLQTIVEAL